jgi:hypothetical protein
LVAGGVVIEDLATPKMGDTSEIAPQGPDFPRALEESHRVFAELRMETGERFDDEAKLDLEKSRELLAKVAEESPTMPSARGELGRTYLVLGNLAKRQKSPSDEYHAKAVAELKRASDVAPEDFFIRRDLDEANASHKH